LGWINDRISYINNTSTGSTPGYGTNRTFDTPGPGIGMYYTNPLYRVETTTSGNTSTINQEMFGSFSTPDFVFNTYPFSGNPSTIIPSLSGSVCNYNSTGVISSLYNSINYTKYKYYYDVRLTNPLDIRDFDIWASPITNFRYSGYTTSTPIYELAYRYSGGSITFSNPTYII
jgi:hypothetical protein